MERILSEIRSFDGVLELAPQPGSEHPEISWGDHFFYFAPDGQVPNNRQPYATIVTKNYPDDVDSRLDAPDRWRLNIHVGTKAAAELLRHASEDIGDSAMDHGAVDHGAVDHGAADHGAADYGAADVFLPHPLYGAYGWVCVVNPAESTLDRALEALRSAHRDDRRRVERRRGDDSALNA
jgi:hypothetical protein